MYLYATSYAKFVAFEEKSHKVMNYFPSDFVFIFVMLSTEPGVLCMVGKCFISGLYS